ncbi:hypothetical protein [Ideonella sp.]|uniref:hypothetical protein n=1 Tax=Ideonella sp. TaxID=1929293 RepID=UPI0035B06BC4
MISIHRRVLVLIGAAMLAGCAGTYSLREGEPKAYVRLRATGDEPTFFRHIPEPLCPEATVNRLAAFAMPFGEQLSEIRMLGSTGQPSRYVYERAVTAGKPFHMLVYSQEISTAYNPGYSCHVGVKVTFQPEHHYEVTYEQERSSCRVRVWELTQAGSDVQKHPVRNAQYFQARSAKDFCGR